MAEPPDHLKSSSSSRHWNQKVMEQNHNNKEDSKGHTSSIVWPTGYGVTGGSRGSWLSEEKSASCWVSGHLPQGTEGEDSLLFLLLVFLWTFLWTVGGAWACGGGDWAFPQDVGMPSTQMVLWSSALIGAANLARRPASLCWPSLLSAP